MTSRAPRRSGPGAVEVLEPELEAGEREAPLRSAGVLTEAWETL